ncbi:hypothetical protein K9M41_02995 [Candidatus Gracilibacteria bacterium]|nr:hypothetical protein [Candidatus Gracilibacteria bacterium]
MRKIFLEIVIITLLIPFFGDNAEAVFRGKRPPINVTKPGSSKEVIINNRHKVTNRSYNKTWDPARGTKLTPTERHVYGVKRMRASARTVRPEREPLTRFTLEEEKPIRRVTDRYSGTNSKSYLRGDRLLERTSHKEKQERYLKRKLRAWDRDKFELSK